MVFRLSYWNRRKPDILRWLVDELQARYKVSRNLSRRWLKDGRLVLLLDGLDDVPTQHLVSCIHAIRQYEFQRFGMCVCCRLNVYRDLPIRLPLECAIRLEPLSIEQVESYLANAGSRFASLKEMLSFDGDLRSMALSPLMLSIICRAYQ